MVVFTCNHCGESVRKPGVEKHYNFVCRKFKDLTCVDCLKDFRGEEFVAHTKCVTEEERYAAKGTYQGGIQKKGEAKQEQWVETVKSIIDLDVHIKPQCKNLLMTISKHNNVPRKRQKFINYIKSATGARASEDVISEVWDIIEKHKEKQLKSTENNEEMSSNKNENNAESIAKDGEELNSVEEKKKIKKQKHTDSVCQCDATENSTVSAEDTTMKKKKVKKNKLENSNENVEDMEQNAEEMKNSEEVYVNGNDVKIKKKKLKQEKLITNEELNDTNINGALEPKPKKKSKGGDSTVNGDENELNKSNGSNINEGQVTRPKKRKSKGGENNISEGKKEEFENLNGTKVDKEDQEPKPKKKKSKGGENISEDKKELENLSGTKVDEEAQEPKPKKKKSKRGQNISEDTEELNNLDSIKVDEEAHEPKLKQKKLKEENSINENKELNSSKGAIIDEESQEPRPKKKKNKGENSTELNHSTGTVVNDSVQEVEINSLENDTVATENNSISFSIEDTVIKILTKKNEISLQKLEKKVINIYLKHAQAEEVPKKFVKKIHKTVGKSEQFEIVDNIVKLKS